MKRLNFNSTKEIKVPEKIIDQVVGQDEAVAIIKKAALQRRNVLLIGEPGTGKSMLGLALAELLPKSTLKDILAYPNPNDENTPIIKEVNAGEGRKIVAHASIQGSASFKNQNFIFLIIAVLVSIIPYYLYYKKIFPFDQSIIYAASMITGMVLIVGIIFMINIGKRMNIRMQVPKVIVDNFNRKRAPFFDATGAHAGALLGDVLHDPFQSGGLGTPANQRVVAGMIHKANGGVLFIDELATLDPRTQQELLTAIQEKKYSITGQSERSAGAMVRTEAVPCDFVLIAAGNLETIKNMHPALRSRIRGYGYEIYMNDTIKDTARNRMRIAKFIAQEITKDKKIPHFSKSGVVEIIEEARRRANRKGHLTLHFRNLGGLVRAAGDLALEMKKPLVDKEIVRKARQLARPLEQQLADKYIARKKEYEVIITTGAKVGRVNGLAVIGGESAYSGIILPIEAEVTSGGKEKEIIATGKLGEIAKEAVKNVSAIIMKHFGEDIKEKYDIFVQFLQTYEGVEGDSASIAVATAIISSLKDIAVRQDIAMTGSLSVRGEVLPVGGVSAKVEAAIDAEIKEVLVPESNIGDIVIDKDKSKKIKIIPVNTIGDVLKYALVWKGREKELKKIIGR